MKQVMITLQNTRTVPVNFNDSDHETEEETHLIHQNNVTTPENNDTTLQNHNTTPETKGITLQNINTAPESTPAQYRRRSSARKKSITNRIHLRWRDIHVELPLPRKKCSRNSSPPKTLSILRGVSGSASPGELVAIMGASGSGKTTLLNVLSGYRALGDLHISGDMSANSTKVENLRNMSAFVHQEDLFVGTLTVKEHLMFQAALRMRGNMTHEEKRQRIRDVIAELGLEKCRNTVIGIPGRVPGISGGEKKRLSFASEMLTDPAVLFVDEVTSGLDAYTARSCVSKLRAVARSQGTTVVMTIHQPSSAVFAMFDQLILLAEGRCAFHGTPPEAMDFFKECGHPVPKDFNPADHYIKTLAVSAGKEEECRTRIGRICDTFADTKAAKTLGIAELSGTETMCPPSLRRPRHFFVQVRELMWRSTRQFFREPLINRIRVVQSIVLSVIIGLLFLNLPADQQGAANTNGLLFLIVSLSFTTATSVVMLFPAEIPIMVKESNLSMYSVGSYFIARNLAEVPWYFLTTTLQATILYWMAGMPPHVAKFIIFLGICHLNTQSAVSYGMILSAAAPTTQAALALAGPAIMPLMVLGGFFVKDASIPVYFVWLKAVSWMRYAFEMVVINQWDGFGSLACANVSAACWPDGAAVLEHMRYDRDNFTRSGVCLLTLIVAFRFVAFLLLVRRSYRT